MGGMEGEDVGEKEGINERTLGMQKKKREG